MQTNITFLEILDELIAMDFDEFHKSFGKHEAWDIAEFLIEMNAIPIQHS